MIDLNDIPVDAIVNYCEEDDTFEIYLQTPLKRIAKTLRNNPRVVIFLKTDEGDVILKMAGEIL